MQVVVDGLLTHYESTGKGSTLLLIHGWGDSLSTYDTLTDALKAYQVVRLDLPGFGATEPPKEVWGLTDYAQFVAAFLAKLELKPQAIVGHSNGGAVAIVGLADNVLTPKKLVLLASAGIRNRQSLRKYLLKAVAKFGKLLTWWLPKRHKRALQKKFYGTIGSDMLVAPHLQETFKRTVAEDITSHAHHLSLPTLLIYGDHDAATPVKDVGIPLHDAIPGSKLHIIHGADHFVHQQATEQVAVQIKEFIS